jgi:hypothetical protein
MAQAHFTGENPADNSGLAKLPSLRYGSFAKPQNVICKKRASLCMRVHPWTRRKY